MAVWDGNTSLVALLLWMSFGRAAASSEQVCYVLDGILFLYGVILTALYFRIKVINAKAEAEARKVKAKQDTADAVYMGLTPHSQAMYETIGNKK